jgi:hypothetical protein
MQPVSRSTSRRYRADFNLLVPAMPDTVQTHLFVSRNGAVFTGGGQAQDPFRRFHADRSPEARWESFAVDLPGGPLPWRQLRTYLRLRHAHLSGVTEQAIARFERTLAQCNPHRVVLGSSLFGALAQRARAHGCQVVIQSHNCEYDYFAGEAAVRGHLSGELLRASWRAERACVEAADLLVALTAYDLHRFEHVYEVDCPIVVTDPNLASLAKRIRETAPWDESAPRSGAVFVGSASRQNLLAAERLVAAWSPELPPLRIIGAVGAEIAARHPGPVLAQRGISAPGFLPSLDAALREAEFMVCPMVLGSGVKVKAIDALANGCRVLASKEAINGFLFAQDSGYVLPFDAHRPGDSIEHARRHSPDASKFLQALDSEVARQTNDLEAALARLPAVSR